MTQPAGAHEDLEATLSDKQTNVPSSFGWSIADDTWSQETDTSEWEKLAGAERAVKINVEADLK